MTLELIAPGGVFGTAALFGGARDSLCAQAATDCVVRIARVRDVQDAIGRDHQTWFCMALQLGERVVRLEQRLQALSAPSARQRLALTLYRLAHESGEDGPAPGQRLLKRVTHAALALEIGASRETVTRQLAALDAQGFLRREGRALIVDHGLLRDFIGQDLEMRTA